MVSSRKTARRPAAIAAEGKAQLLRYPSVNWLEAAADDARVLPDGRLAFLVGAIEVRAKLLVLGTGVHDELPVVPGLAEQWAGASSIAHSATATN